MATVAGVATGPLVNVSVLPGPLGASGGRKGARSSRAADETTSGGAAGLIWLAVEIRAIAGVGVGDGVFEIRIDARRDLARFTANINQAVELLVMTVPDN